MKVKVVALPVETWAVILDVLGSATDCGPRDEGWKSPELSEAHAALDFALGRTEEIESPTYEEFMQAAAAAPIEPPAAPEPFFVSPPLVNRLRPALDKSEILSSAMSLAIQPDGYDEALEEVVKTLESPVEWTQVESSNLSAVAYQEDLQLLLVEFKGGKVYKYAGVPKGVFESLMSADSKGRFFAANIKDHFPHEKLEVKREQD